MVWYSLGFEIKTTTKNNGFLLFSENCPTNPMILSLEKGVFFWGPSALYLFCISSAQLPGSSWFAFPSVRTGHKTYTIGWGDAEFFWALESRLHKGWNSGYSGSDVNHRLIARLFISCEESKNSAMYRYRLQKWHPLSISINKLSTSLWSLLVLMT